MARKSVLGLYEDPEGGANAIDGLHSAGFDSTQYDVLTGTPYPEGAFGERLPHHMVFRFPLFGALIGFTFGLLIAAGTQLAYPLVTGGKPLLALPAMFIVVFEMTILVAAIVTVIGVLFESRLPDFNFSAYDPRISEGLIGVAVNCEEDRLAEVNQIFQNTGAMEIKSA